MKKTVCSVDVAKFICALLVISLHCNPFRTIEDPWGRELSFILASVANVAVPLFYSFSAFFFFSSRRSESFRGLFRFLFRISVLYVVWMSITFIPLYFRIGGQSSFFCWILNDATKSQPNYLWFFPAVSFGIVFCWVFVSFQCRKTLNLLSMALFLSFYFIEGYAGVFPETRLPEFSSMAHSRFYLGRIWFAIPYLCIGVHFAQKQPSENGKHRTMLMLGLLAIIGLWAERFVVIRVFQTPFNHSTPEVWIFAFVACFAISRYLFGASRSPSKRIYRFFRASSVILYVTYGIILARYSGVIVRHLGGWSLYPAVVCLGIGLTLVILTLESLKPFSWLSWIH